MVYDMSVVNAPMTKTMALAEVVEARLKVSEFFEHMGDYDSYNCDTVLRWLDLYGV
jgi:hypothetical protein